eukprot:TRINITY_DN52684_c0_g1_i1.p1 TRINITY_DN52684_c0_g1~~TRINITY_DN52684_c0_g1_i1.p1  ORF type:complete len:180 (+),score=28.54 TRINITY_DN52684_c0_g1_i1:77-541(+)
MVAVGALRTLCTSLNPSLRFRFLKSGQLCQTAVLSNRRAFSVDADEGEEEGTLDEMTEGFWNRRWRRVKKRRARTHHQVESAHDHVRAFYDMGRTRLVASGKLSPEDAAAFARIDERLFALQRNKVQLEFYDRRKQFHEEYVQKNFVLGKKDEE